MAICAAQGGFRSPPVAAWRRVVKAPRAGRVVAIDNRRIARIAKLAGVPGRKAAGLLLRASRGDQVARGTPLYEIHAETEGELEWARDYARSRAHPFVIAED